MAIKHAYQALLRLYPADYKASFAAEMLNTFMKATEACRAQGRLRFVRFTLAELVGIIIGAANEWVSKWTTDSSIRGRCLPDLQKMRPPGVPQKLWFAGASANLEGHVQQDEMVKTEKQLEILIGHMVHAIANHDFPKARIYSDQERAVREHLRHLQEMHNVHGRL